MSRPQPAEGVPVSFDKGWQIVRLEDVPSTLWRNRRGTTRELLAWPHPDEWRLRISVAEIARDGPFSFYPASERWFSVLEGDGVGLTVGGGTQIITPDSEPFCFSGNAKVDCKLLAGPTWDLNMIALPGAGRMLRVRDAHIGEVKARSLLAGYAQSPGAIAVYDEHVLDLEPGMLAWRLLEQEGPAVIEGEHAFWIEVRL